MIAKNPAFVDVRRYAVRSVDYAIEGEGARAGIASVGISFSGCDLACSIEREGFNCDADFSERGPKIEAGTILADVRRADRAPKGCGWALLTGGEPTLQLDAPLRDALRDAGYRVAIETNGIRALPASVDYVAVAPKRGRPCRLQHANECRIVLGPGVNPDAAQLEMAARSNEVFILPAFFGPPSSEWSAWHARTRTPLDTIDPAAVEWCAEIVRKSPRFRLSISISRALGVR